MSRLPQLPLAFEPSPQLKPSVTPHPSLVPKRKREEGGERREKGRRLVTPPSLPTTHSFHPTSFLDFLRDSSPHMFQIHDTPPPNLHESRLPLPIPVFFPQKVRELISFLCISHTSMINN